MPWKWGFQIAVAAGASIAVRAVRDEMDLSIAAGQHAVFGPEPPVALDVFARAELDDSSLMSAARSLTQHAPDISVVVMITGSARRDRDPPGCCRFPAPGFRCCGAELTPRARPGCRRSVPRRCSLLRGWPTCQSCCEV